MRAIIRRAGDDILIVRAHAGLYEKGFIFVASETGDSCNE